MPVSAENRISDRFAHAMRGYDGATLGLAVSGGGDSVAMLRLAVDWASTHGVTVFCYCVDHGLRPESAEEASFVADLCKALGIACRILKWQGWDGTGNLSAQARAARYELIAQAAQADQVDTVLLAHTQDDQAETVLMSLARRAGVDGLSGMPRVKCDRGIVWMRPLLDVGRQELREYLDGLGQAWCDDPSNEDTGYERVRMRKAQPALDVLGLSVGALADVASNMQTVRDALNAATADALGLHAESVHGAVRLEEPFWRVPAELKRRALSKCLHWVAPTALPVRGEQLGRALEDIESGKTITLQGCLIQRRQSTVWIIREPGAVREEKTGMTEIWDGRWRIKGPAITNAHISALGERGIAECKNWRDSGIPRGFFLSSPAIWQGERLIAAPLAGYGQGWSADLIRSDADFHNACARR